MITSAIGRPIPKAPPIICTNAESKLSSSWTSTRFDIPLLRRAPTSTARRPNDEQEALGGSLKIEFTLNGFYAGLGASLIGIATRCARHSDCSDEGTT